MTARQTLLAVAWVAAAVGAGFGWYVGFHDRPPLPTVGVLLIAVALGAAVPMLVVDLRARPVPPVPPPVRPPTTVPPVPTADGWWAQAGPARRPAPAAVDRRTATDPGPAAERGTVRISTPEPAPAAPREAVRLVLPVDGYAHPGPWPVPTDPSHADPPGRPGAAELARYRGSARIVQCPRCGSFRIDVTGIGARPDAGFAFRCRADDHEWTWRPGTPWPATVVASRRRTDR